MKLNTDQRRLTPAALAAAASGNMKNFLAASTPGGIEAQEKAGQLEQEAKQTLPADMGSYRPALEKLGFVFGKPAEGIFVEATFPKGWKKKATDHSMWSDLVDDKGRKRGSIFYKAAFYDRSAHLHLSPRFSVGETYEGVKRVYVKDACGVVKKEVTLAPEPDHATDREAWRKWYDRKDEIRQELHAWLRTEYPGYESPIAYWDAV